VSASCCNQTSADPRRGDEGYRRVLWAVLAINAAMFAIDVAAGVAAEVGVAAGRRPRFPGQCRKLRHVALGMGPHA
jgi:hypothetical protein